MDDLGYPRLLALDSDQLLGSVFDDHGQFGISVAKHAPIVDIGTSDQSDVVVDDHYLRVDVDLLGRGITTRHLAMLPQAIEFNILLRSFSVFSKSV